MSHTIHMGYQSQVIEVAYKVDERVFPVTNGLKRTMDVLRYGADRGIYTSTMNNIRSPIVIFLLGDALIFPAKPISNWVGWGNLGDDPSDVVVPGLRPVKTPYDPVQDRRLFSGYFTGIYALLHPQQVATLVQAEHGVVHENIHGSSSVGSEVTQYPGFLTGDVVESRYGVDLLRLKDGRGFRSAVYDDVLGTFTGLDEQVASTVCAKCSFAESLDKLQQYIGANGGWTMDILEYLQRTFYSITSLSWNRFSRNGSAGIRINTAGTVKRYAANAYPNVNRWAQIWFEDSLEFFLDPAGSQFISSGQKDVMCVLETSYSVKFSDGYAYQWDNTSDPYNLKASFAHLCGQLGEFSYRVKDTDTYLSGGGPLFSSDVGGDHVRVTSSNLLAAYTRKFRGLNIHVYEDLPRLTPLCFYSTADALRKYTDIVSANWLETLSDAKDISAFLPSVGSLMRLFRAIRRRDLGGTMREALDTATGAYLWDQFARRPLQKDAKEAVDKYDRIVDVLRSEGIWGPRTLYGEYHWDHSQGYIGYPDVHFEAHTKTRLLFEDFALLSLLFSTKAVGLAPTLSNLWELVPFSFVLDWFSSMGERLEDIDTQLTLLLLPHYYSLHSIKASIAYPGDISGYDLVTGEDGEATVYYRMLSLTLPTLRWTGYDFRPSPGIEGKLKTVGSLAWQVLT